MHWLLHLLGADNGSGPFYLFGSGTGGMLLEVVCLGSISWLIKRVIARHHREKLAQDARHHRERLEQDKAHHQALKDHLSAHCADIKGHVSAVAGARDERVVLPPATRRKAEPRKPQNTSSERM